MSEWRRQKGPEWVFEKLSSGVMLQITFKAEICDTLGIHAGNRVVLRRSLARNDRLVVIKVEAAHQWHRQSAL